jgi:hypothetical protein
MKKITIVVLLCSLGAWTTKAQQAANFMDDTDPEKKISWGLKAGGNYTYFTGSGANSGSEIKIGLHAGAFLEIPLFERFSLQAEAVYSFQGDAYEGVIIQTEELSYSFKGEYNVNYINVPILAKYYITRGWSLEGGPQIGFKVKEREITTTLFEDGTTVDFDGKRDRFSDVNLSFAFGTTYEFQNGIFVSGRFIRESSKNQPNANDLEIGHENYQLSFGYKF